MTKFEDLSLREKILFRLEFFFFDFPIIRNFFYRMLHWGEHEAYEQAYKDASKRFKIREESLVKQARAEGFMAGIDFIQKIRNLTPDGITNLIQKLAQKEAK